jgi:hypothetical protein
MNWRPDYTPALMRRELDIIRAGLHANAVRLGGRDPRRLLAAADYAASIGLNVWLGPELWNATPQRTLSYITEAAAAAEPLFRRWPDRLTFCVGNELTLFMRGIVSGRSHAQRSRSPRLREVVLSGQEHCAHSWPRRRPQCGASTAARSATAPCRSSVSTGTTSTLSASTTTASKLSAPTST